MNTIYKLSQLKNNNRITYTESREICSNNKNLHKMHLGQLKLFFSELIFLSKYAKTDDIILYIGAAEGYHISLLADFFPKTQFHLWDPRKFDLIPKPNITLFNAYFTDQTAVSYQNPSVPLPKDLPKLNKNIKPNKILLMCDMRDLKIRRYRKDKDGRNTDYLIMDDMDLQAEWCKIINPRRAYLKFRLPYNIHDLTKEKFVSSNNKKKKEIYSYFKGTVYFQPYAPLSTESRILVKNYNEMIDYDVVQYDEMMAYFNAKYRCVTDNSSRWKSVMKKYNLYPIWDNIVSLDITHYYLVNIKKINSKEETGKLFMKIVQFHIDKYGKKYDVIFNQ